MKRKTKSILANIALPLAIGGASAVLTKDSMEIFDYVNKPPLVPPDWLFPVVWTILYILMGLAAYFVHNSHKPGKKIDSALLFYGIQLIFNFFWPIFFFNMQKYLFAFIWLLALWILILITTVKFFGIEKKSGYLMLPYIIWTTFAAYLNLGVYILN